MHFLYGFTKDNEIILDHATFHSKNALTNNERNSLFAAISKIAKFQWQMVKRYHSLIYW